MEKEAGLAEDLQWHEMDLLPNLTYTWKGKGMSVTAAATHRQCARRSAVQAGSATAERRALLSS
jgi:hypothetical protein